MKIAPRWNGEVSISYDALKTVKDGTKAQIAVVVPEYCPDELPLHQVFKSFPTGPAGQKQVDFFRGVYDEIPELLQEIDAQELHIISDDRQAINRAADFPSFGQSKALHE